MEQKSKILKNSIVIDVLFHDMFEDPPFECKADYFLVDMLLNAGVNTVSTTIVADTYGEANFIDFCHAVYLYYLFEETFPDKVKLIYKSQDIKDAKNEGKLGVILSTQGADIVQQDLRLITMAFKLGLRIMQITYNQNGFMGSGVFEPNDLGITRFGQQAIYEMNRLGMVIDLSHVGYKTSMDAIETSTDPVIFSHSGVKGICKNPRNANDDQIIALAKKGGVLGLCPHSVMCTDDTSKMPDVNTFIDHMVYVSDLVGTDHIGIGTDRFVQPTMQHLMTRREFERTLPGFFGVYDATTKQVKGFNRFNEWENLVENMLIRGFSDDDIEKILGKNLIRVFETVWDKNLKK